MEDDEACNTGLCLGLGMEGYVAKKKKQREKQQVPLELCSKGDQEALHRLQDDEEEDGFTLMRIHHNNNSNNCRKKLRLTKDQSALLENSFNLHSTLNPAQKQALADELNLKPRQVEVWFQNRRARTKLKQTEVECELLKKCCENLTDENGRLKRELQELRALKVEAVSSPFYIQLSKAATLALCSSCQKLFKPNHSTKPE